MIINTFLGIPYFIHKCAEKISERFKFIDQYDFLCRIFNSKIKQCIIFHVIQFIHLYCRLTILNVNQKVIIEDQ